jgi:tetratricopeptide (TPR) repeat protein
MQITLERLQYWIDSKQQPISKFYLIGLIVMLAAVSLSWTISYIDTDMWYHLSGGRYLLEYGALYNPFSNSYLEPAREFVNYYWGFQGIAYLLWLAAGPFGLIALKTLLLVICAWFATKILLSDLPLDRATLLHLLVISITVVLLCAKGTTIRPHLFSYCFISLFIYILLYRDKWLPVLPFITILWINVHGVEWVISALIGGCYVLKKLLDYYQNRDPQVLKSTVWVFACIPALLVNPNGVYILATPFVPSSEIYLFISELLPIPFYPVISFTNGLNTYSVFLICVLFYLAALFHALRDPYKNFFPLLLALGGTILLFRAQRFIWEWLLLCTPLFSVALSAWGTPRIELKRFLLLLGLTGFMFYPFWSTNSQVLSGYPLDENSFAMGTTGFINKLQIKGKYALPPNHAGYVEWAAHSDIKIHSDMQFGPFNENDLFELHVSNLSQHGFQNYVKKYQPDLFAVRKDNKHFPAFIDTQQTYIPVFYDRKLVLYINSEHYPEIAAEYAIKYLNPYNTNEIPATDIDKGIDELKRMLAIVENLPELRLTLIEFLIKKGDLDEAKAHLTPLLHLYPANESVLFFSSRIALLEENYELALDHYLTLLPLATDPDLIKRLTAECYFLNGDVQQAYDMYKSALNPYRETSFNPQHYYQFALSSYVVGDMEGAHRLVNMIELFNDGSVPEIEKLTSDLKRTILEEGD